MTDQRPITTTVKGLAYGLLAGWGAGMLWWGSLVLVFAVLLSAESSVVTSVTLDRTGRHETRITVWERVASIPLRAIPWAVIGGIAGTAVGWNRGRPATEERPRFGRRVVAGMAYGLLVGWIVGVVGWASLATAFGPIGTDNVDFGGRRVQHFYLLLDMFAYVRWTVVPWALVGAMTGAIIGRIGGWLEVITCFAGMMCGIFVVLLNARFDGWLALTIPIFAFIGIGIGLVVGLIVRLATRRVRLAGG